jgi:hypothetical protein
MAAPLHLPVLLPKNLDRLRVICAAHCQQLLVLLLRPSVKFRWFCWVIEIHRASAFAVKLADHPWSVAVAHSCLLPDLHPCLRWDWDRVLESWAYMVIADVLKKRKEL